MNIPRLVLAEEKRAGKISQSILVASVLKSLGYPLRFFCAGPDEHLVRFLKLLTEQNVTVLDPFSCGSIRNLKLLFQQAAVPDALNIVFGSLGQRGEGDSFSVNPLPGEVARILECPLVMTLYADSSAAVTSRILENVAGQIASQGAVPSAVLFSSVLNPREYQLLEIEAGRRSALLCLGFIPKTLEKDAPPLLELCLQDMAQRAAFPVKAATAQLLGMLNQVEWNVLWGVAKQSKECVPIPESLKGKASGMRVGILSHPAFDLEGNNAELFFKYLGCSVQHVSLDSSVLHTNLNALYVPHGPGFLCAERLLGKSGIRDWFVSFFLSRKPVLVNGGITPLLGESFSLPNKKQYEGLKLFRFRGQFSIPSPEDVRKVEALCISEKDIMLNQGEKIRGYLPAYASVIDPGNTSDALWSVEDPAKGVQIALSGWSRGSSLATEICLDLWSNMEGVYRWLMMRKQ